MQACGRWSAVTRRDFRGATTSARSTVERAVGVGRRRDGRTTERLGRWTVGGRHGVESAKATEGAEATTTTTTESYSFMNLARAEFPSDWGDPGVKVRYEDSPLDLAIMAWFMRKIGMAIDAPPPSKVSYEEFIALCFLQMRGRDAIGMGDVTSGVIRSLVPPGGNSVFKKLFPLNQFSCELNATITKIVFAWMVGPMEVETTVDNDLGIEMASKVHIKKCRWLQESGCTAMCVNMCKTATQEVFTDDFGLPLTIKPNFEDKSCDFYFGLSPPPIEKDEALLFGCNASCATAATNSDGEPCHKLRPYKGM